MTYVKRQKGWRMSCHVGEATEGLENEQSRAIILTACKQTVRTKESILMQLLYPNRNYHKYKVRNTYYYYGMFYSRLLFSKEM